MTEPHVVTALITKRAEIAGQIEHTQTSLRQLIIDLDMKEARRLYRRAHKKGTLLRDHKNGLARRKLHRASRT